MKNVKLIMTNEKKEQSKNGSKIACLTFFILHFSLFICTCDLFNNQVDPDFRKNIDGEIAWSNAAKLNLTVWYIPLWGTSPQQGELDRETHRQGHYFNVEFTPAPGYGFVDWVAFRTNGLDLTNIDGEANKALILDVNEVNIVPGTNTVGGAFSYKIKINITDPVTLVPLCSDRPRLSSRTYPPLNPVPIAFPYNQKIDIWFNMPVQTEGLELGEGKITVSGTYLINKGGYRIGDDFENHGDITDYFKLEVPQNYDGSVNHVTLVPAGEGKRISDLAYLTITVKVGPDINKKNVGDSEDIGMAGAESFSFMTDSSEMKKTYIAYKIRVEEKVPSADPKEWFGDDPSFAGTSISDPAIDRRFKYNDTLTLSFDIDTREDPPTRVLLIEQRFLELDCVSEIDDDLIQEDFGIDEFTLVETYDAYEEKEISTYTLKNYPIKTTSSGIIRLLVLPWYFPDVAPIELNDAIAAVRYVNIVIDGEAPELDEPDVTISNYSRTDRSDQNLYFYGNKGDKNKVTVTIENLGSIVDNTNGGGIPKGNQTYPAWTKNDNDLYWQVKIGENGEITSGDDWLPVYNGSGLNNQWQSGTISALTDYEKGYPVSVRFKDRPGNETDWVPTGKKVSFRSDNGSPVTNLRAVCNAAGSTITVSWDQPDGVEYPMYKYPIIEIQSYRASASGDVVIGKTTHNFDREKAGSYEIKPSTITTKDVLTDDMSDGTAVSGVYGYEITVITDNGAEQDEEAGPIWVYNIPGMSVTETNTLRITDANQLSTLTSNDLAKNIILTKNIAIDNHTPISTFTGKFYGNGHKITINRMDASSANMGLFGVASNALIRDLTVDHRSTATISYSGTAQVYIGGITGHAQNTTQISNCMVKGTLYVSSGTKIHIGGIAGAMSHATAKLVNCDSYINLSATTTTTASVESCVGGITGQIWTSGNSNVLDADANTNIMIDNVKSTGNVTVQSNGGIIYLGGIVGDCRGKGIIQKAVVSGTLSMSAQGQGEHMFGGIIGYIAETNILNLKTSGFTGTITILEPTVTTVNSGTIYAGGLIAQSKSSCSVSQCYAKGDITVKTRGTNTAYAGGLMGRFEGSGLISNSYALSNVSVDRTSGTGTIYVGGMVGAFYSTSGSGNGIQKCFNKGNVIAKSNGTGTVYEGGMVGYMQSDNSSRNVYLQHNATLGERVVYRGDDPNNSSVRKYGRLGAINSADNITANNNYAFEEMRNDPGFYGATIDYAIPEVSWGTGSTFFDEWDGNPLTFRFNAGKGTKDSDFHTINFWTKSDGIAFSGSIWDLSDSSNVENRGYPLLLNMGGQE